MNHTTLTAIFKMLESTLTRLEDAIDNNDHRRVGAALYELRRDIHDLKTHLQDQDPEG
jgi:hypothetical protein